MGTLSRRVLLVLHGFRSLWGSIRDRTVSIQLSGTRGRHTRGRVIYPSGGGRSKIQSWYSMHEENASNDGFGLWATGFGRRGGLQALGFRLQVLRAQRSRSHGRLAEVAGAKCNVSATKAHLSLKQTSPAQKPGAWSPKPEA